MSDLLPDCSKDQIRIVKIQGQKHKPGSLFFRLMPFLLIAFGFFYQFTGLPVSAQENPSLIVLGNTDLTSFPEISFSFKAWDANGQPYQRVNPEQVGIIEDNNDIEPLAVTPQKGKTHFILAVNAGRALALRDSSGVTNYDYLMKSFDHFRQEMTDNDQNEWSFLVNQGRSLFKINDLQVWYAGVSAYQPDMRTLSPGLSSLISGIDLATIQAKDITTDQVMLYITPLPEPGDLEKLLSLKQSALSSGLHINIWLVGNEVDFNSPRGQALYDLSRSTGGSFFLFSGNETVPNPQNYLAPYGTYFRASYRSMVRQSGKFNLAIRISQEPTDLVSDPLSISIKVLPPEAAFLSPPLEIVRTLPAPAEDETPDQSDMQKISVLVTFPDRHPRNLKYLRLYQDDVLVFEKKEPPYSHVEWDISLVEVSSLVNLQVVVEDEIGLTATSSSLPVMVNVEQPATPGNKTGISAETVKYLLLGLIFILIMGTISLFIVQYHKRSQTKQSKGPSAHQSFAHQDRVDPTYRGNARLLWLDKDNQPLNRDPFKLPAHHVLIGSHPIKCNLVIEEKTVDPLHARIDYFPQDGYRLSDLGSVAGTWVNYAPISRSGVILEDMDLIHIGRVSFHFSLKKSV